MNRNIYAYVGGNPISFVDPLGLSRCGCDGNRYGPDAQNVEKTPLGDRATDLNARRQQRRSDMHGLLGASAFFFPGKLVERATSGFTGFLIARTFENATSPVQLYSSDHAFSYAESHADHAAHVSGFVDKQGAVKEITVLENCE